MLETSAAKCKDVQKDKRRNSILEMFFAAERKEKKKKAQPSVLVIIVHSSFPPSRKTSALSVGKDLVDAKIINQYEKIPDSP
jgi:hypothetical protein